MNEADNELRGAFGPLSVAVIGLGTIGGAVARHLVGADIAVSVFDVRPGATEEFVSQGARRASSCADAASRADVVIEAVVNDAQLLDVMTGPDGVLSTVRPGAVIILHSTVRLSTVREVAAAAAAKSVRVIDAGVSTRGSHGTDKLAVFVGGAAEDVDLVRPVLERYTHCLDYLGPLGSGMTAKLVRNLLGYLFMAAAYEPLALAEAVGVDLNAFRRIIEESDVASQAQLILQLPTTHPLTESKVAVETVEKVTGLHGEQLRAFLESSASLMEKDLDDIVALADDAGFEVRLAKNARRLVREFILLPPADHGPAARPESEAYQRGLAALRRVYAGEMVELPEGTLAFNDVMLKTLFAEVWTRDVLSMRDRRLLLLGTIAARGAPDMWRVHARAALRNGELTPDELRETLVMLAPYAGYPATGPLVVLCEEVIGAVQQEHLNA